MTLTFNHKDQTSKAIRVSACDDGGEIGHAYLFLITNDLHSEPYGLLEDVMVNEDQRGGGTGTKIVEEVIRTAKEMGCYKILATSRFSRENVHRWYERQGFEKNGFDFRLNLK